MTQKAILINDLSGLGKCSLTAAIPVLSVMGIQPCPMPTAVLTNQTGYKSYYCRDLSGDLQQYITEWEKLNFKPDGIYTGFLSNESQVEIILGLIDKFKTDDILIMVDPVMGDNGKKYDLFTAKLAQEMKTLVSKAHIITPNLTECCLLCDCDYNTLVAHKNDDYYLEAVKELAKKLLSLYPVEMAVITGIVHKEFICNLVYSQNGFYITKTPMIGNSYSGTGDLFSSVVFGCVLKGIDLNRAVDRAVDFIEKSIKDTVNVVKDRNDGIEFEKNLSVLMEL